MKILIPILIGLLVVGCGEFKDGFEKGFDRQKKVTEARAAAQKKAEEAAKPPQQTKAKSDKLIADPIVEKVIRRQLRKYTGDLTDTDIEKVTFLRFIGNLNDEGLKELSKLKQLKVLILADTKITGEGLRELVKFQELTELYLEGTKITGEGVKELVKLQKLTELTLKKTQITDADLKELAKLQNLKILNLNGCAKITDGGVSDLKKALPGPVIFYSP